MEQEGKLNIECNPSAFKHGVIEEDIRFAFDNRLFDHPIAHHEDKNLLIGLDRQLNPLEIIPHAMKCRKAWRNLAKLEEKLWQK